ncbi:uncharacterized protein [Phyllobates terribilis]|uniref:uncharacterized protein n=1 Tax=Phyllobates terribilis TaxID=111132 RepID=UPI003CCB701F
MEQMPTAEEDSNIEFDASEIEYVNYGGEHHLPLIMRLVDEELSEPYSIFTYRYFVYLWPQLSFLAFHKGRCVGTVVCKMGEHRNVFRGYIAMLVVIKPCRGKGIATELVARSIKVMMESGCEEVTLEAEVTNKGALALYGGLGFIRAKRLFRYYLNGVDAYRLKLMFPRPQVHPSLPVLIDTDIHGDQINTEYVFLLCFALLSTRLLLNLLLYCRNIRVLKIKTSKSVGRPAYLAKILISPNTKTNHKNFMATTFSELIFPMERATPRLVRCSCATDMLQLRC